MDFEKIYLTKLKFIDSHNLKFTKQSYQWIYYYATSDKPRKIALEYRMGNEATSIAFTNKGEFYTFISECVYAYVYFITKHINPDLPYDDFLQKYINYLCSEIQRDVNRKFK